MKGEGVGRCELDREGWVGGFVVGGVKEGGEAGDDVGVAV